jgi:hypothetical protein
MRRNRDMVVALIELYTDLAISQEQFNKSLPSHVEIDNIPVYDHLERLEQRLRKELGMPKEDILGEFIFDYWFDLLYKVEEGEAKVEDIIDEFMNWDKMED